MRLVRIRDDDAAAVECQLAVPIGKRIAVEEDRTVLFPHADGELIHDAAVHADEFILCLLRELHQFHHINAEVQLIVQDDRHQHLDGCRGGEPCTVRQRTIEDNVKAVRCPMPRVLHHAHNADGIVRPAVGIALHRAVHGELHHALLRQIHRVEPRDAVRARCSERIRPEGDRTGEDVPAVVVRVLTDEIHASR